MAKFFDHIEGFTITSGNSESNTEILLQVSDRPILHVGNINYGSIITTNTSGSTFSQTIYGEIVLKSADNNHHLTLNNNGIAITGGLTTDSLNTTNLNSRNITTNFWADSSTSSLKVKDALNANTLADTYYYANVAISKTPQTNTSPRFASCTVDNDIQSGTVHATTFYAASDRRLKENIQIYTDGLDIINKISVKSYNWIKDNTKQKNIGCVAQELEAVLPEDIQKFFVDKNKDGYLAVNDSKLIYLLINAVKDLQQQINQLKK